MQTWHETSDLMTNQLKPSYKCKYCNKEFRKESTLAAHLCEEKRRWQEEKETGVQFGLQAYLRFYELTQGSAKMKSYTDFVASPYYRAFVKFGRHMVGIRAVNPKMFIDYVIKENKKLDHWCHEKVYLEYLKQYMRKEAVQDALTPGDQILNEKKEVIGQLVRSARENDSKTNMLVELRVDQAHETLYIKNYLIEINFEERKIFD